MTRVGVFGLGYVGSVTAACLAAEGHHVVGVDVNSVKLDSVRRGRGPVGEKGLDEILERVVSSGHLRVTSDAADAVASTDVSLVCVGTPSQRNGSLDLSAIEKVCNEIGGAMSAQSDRHHVVMRSTVLPGTAREVVIPVLEASSGLSVGDGFGYAVNPEFLREGSAVADFSNAEFTLIGASDSRTAAVVAGLYAGIDAPTVQVDLETAEMVKYASNAFHALKVGFANEIGSIARSHGVDGRQVMDVLCLDHKLNISPAYLRPGFAFGGSCLPKDMRALVYQAVRQDVEIPLLSSVLPSNEVQIRRAITAVEEAGGSRVGILGLAFKAGTDDVRESPTVAVIEALVGKGYDVTVFDEDVSLNRLTGANKLFLQSEIPHIANLMVEEMDEVLASSEVLVVATASEAFAELGRRMAPDQTLIDLVGSVDTTTPPRGTYRGSGW